MSETAVGGKVQAWCRVMVGKKFCDMVADASMETKTGVIFKCPRRHTFSVSNYEIECCREGQAIPRTVQARAHARTTDPATSHAAAKALDPEKLAVNQKGVMRLFESYGSMTDHQLVDRYKPVAILDPDRHPAQSDSGLRTRRAELTRGKLLHDTGQRMVRGGRGSIVWGLVE